MDAAVWPGGCVAKAAHTGVWTSRRLRVAEKRHNISPIQRASGTSWQHRT
jgi:hypothetical protein